MEESFKLPVTYKNKELEFEAKLLAFGYVHKFHIDIDGVEVLFEPDEESNYRAILDEEALAKQLKPNIELVQLVGNKIAELFK